MLRTPRENRVIDTVNHRDWTNGITSSPFFRRLGWLPLSALGSIASWLMTYRIIASAMVAVTLAGSGLVAGILLSIRRDRIRRSKLGEAHHHLEHTVRMLLPPLCRRARDRVRLDEAAKQFWTAVANDVAEFFAVLLSLAESRTGCLIWLRDNSGQFFVVGRGGKITTDVATLENISNDPTKGVIRQVMETMRQRGVFIINSLVDAMRERQWEAIGLENLECVKSVAVVPINAPAPSRRLLGLLMITSDEAGVFQPHQAEHLKAMADKLATYEILTEVDESPSSTLGFEPSKFVRMTSDMDFAALFARLQPGQILYWLDTFCPGHESWLPEMQRALARGARVVMLLLDTNSKTAHKRARELATCYGEQKFLRDLEEFNNAMKECQRHAAKHGCGSLTLVIYDDLLGSPSYVVCDDHDEPMYGYSSEYLCGPSVIARHFSWTAHHPDELKARLEYILAKLRRNDHQGMLFEPYYR